MNRWLRLSRSFFLATAATSRRRRPTAMASAAPAAAARPDSVGAWASTLRTEYLAARAAQAAGGGEAVAAGGGAGALRRVVSRYLHAFSAAGSAEARKSRDFFDLQVDEARCAMYVSGSDASSAQLRAMRRCPLPPTAVHQRLLTSPLPRRPPRSLRRQIDADRARTLFKSLKNASYAKSVWEPWRLFLIFEARHGA